MTLQVLVTGGSRGIGLACALNLARGGANVWIAARQSKNLEQACQHALKKGLKLHPLVLDVSRAEAFEQLKEQAPQCQAQILIHAAGSSGYSYILDPKDPQLWQRLIDSNLNGAYYASRFVLPAMQAQNWGRIVFISSVLGLRGMRNSHAYCASKHGLNGLTKALAQDLIGSGITVNAVCPGWVDTQMGHESLEAMAQHYQIPKDLLETEEIAAIPIQRWIQAEEVAALVDYLVSDQAAAMTGQCLEISGGLA